MEVLLYVYIYDPTKKNLYEGHTPYGKIDRRWQWSMFCTRPGQTAVQWPRPRRTVASDFLCFCRYESLPTFVGEDGWRTLLVCCCVGGEEDYSYFCIAPNSEWLIGLGLYIHPRWTEM